MKNNKLNFVLTLLVAFCVTTMTAQDKATQIKKDAPKINKEIEKVKDQKNKDFEDKVEAKGGSYTDVANTVKGKPNGMDQDVTSARKTIAQIEAQYSKKIRATNDPKEQARLKEEMQEKIIAIKNKVDKSGETVINNTNNNSSSSGAVKPKEDSKEDTQVNKGKPTLAIKNEKISSTKNTISARRKSLDNRRAMLKKANEKVAAAKDRITAAKDDGSLSEEEIAAKEAKIAAAEAKIKKLEASIQNAEKKYDEKETKLSNFAKDKEN